MTKSKSHRFAPLFVAVLLSVLAGVLVVGSPGLAQGTKETSSDGASNAAASVEKGSPTREDVPDLRREEDFEGQDYEEPMGPPEIVVDWSPKPVIAGPNGFVSVSARSVRPEDLIRLYNRLLTARHLGKMRV